WYSLHINCGGKAAIIGKIKYEGDEDPAGAAKFVHASENWGFNSTGHWDVTPPLNDYVANTASILTMNNTELYTSARLSPLSFTYYARCLANGNYTVKLHFAEIVFRDNRSFYSLGRRIFDVYVQEERVMKDFDIEKTAQGVNKAFVQGFKAVVMNKVLMIRFYWAGKGTTVAPKKVTYGPLISAISVDDFSAPDNGKMKTFIVVGALAFFGGKAVWEGGYQGNKEVGTMYKLFLQGVMYFLQGVLYKDSIHVFFTRDHG
ncbi:probable leucine-rich repeat receptor-like serine/threonine-protein kinase At3g14840, partial [Fagus crenata]